MMFMRNSFKCICQLICAVALVTLIFQAHTIVFAETPTPQIPETSVPVPEASQPEPMPNPREVLTELTKGNDFPAELIIPSIKLHKPVIEVGINEKGEMDVPDGNTQNTGWYKYGTIPGNIGTAVIDAHVYAAFKNLRYAKVGDDIYVKQRSGKYLRFRIEDSRVYKLSEVPREKLFNQQDARRLNLITCAGKYSAKNETYSHRLIVYAVLVDE